MKLLFTMLLVPFLTACSATFYKADLDADVAGLRVATTHPGNTGFALLKNFDCVNKKSATRLSLGWFHPVGFGQAGRRGYDKRIGLKGGDKYKSNMQAEHYINTAETIRIDVNNVSGFGTFLRVCEAYYDVNLEKNKNYELFLGDTEDMCYLIAYELIDDNDEVMRKQIPTKQVCE